MENDKSLFGFDLRAKMYEGYEGDKDEKDTDGDEGAEEKPSIDESPDNAVKEETGKEEETSKGKPEESGEEEKTPKEKPEEYQQTEESEKRKRSMLDDLRLEREKRKALRRELETLKNELTQLRESGKNAETSEDTDDYDPDVRLKRELETLKNEISNLKSSLSDFSKTRQRETIEAQISRTALTLEKEGYPGFDQFSPLVSDELAKLVADDPDNAILDNPAGWMEIYKKVVFPKLDTVVKGRSKKEAFTEKKEKAQKASLLNPAKSATDGGAKVKDSPWTTDDYIKYRSEKGWLQR